MTNKSKKFLASEKWRQQVRGAMWQHKKIVIPTLICLLLGVGGLIYMCFFMKEQAPQVVKGCCALVPSESATQKNDAIISILTRISWAAFVICLFISTIYVVRTLTPIFSLRKKETYITWSQTWVLIAFGIMIIGLILVLNVSKDSAAYLSLTVIGAVLGWVFQDTIKSVVAFFYLRANGLIHIGDWIELPSHGVDGMLKTITLTTATVENWDTTTSAFPTYLLHSEHFMNNQKMMEGRTHGRRMMKTFIIDTGWIHAVSEKEAEYIKQKIEPCGLESLTKEIVVNETLNIEIYRRYLYHWLMQHEKVSHEPRLIVRWLEQTNEGLPLQVYAFITDTNLAPFEWQQSKIIEHIVKSLEWFDLQLYQSPSGYDASNNNLYLTRKQANYRKEHNV